MKKVTKMKNKPNSNATVGKMIEYERREQGISQGKLGEMVGNRKREEITMWETGQRVPDAYVLKEIAKALNVSTDYLLGLTEFKSPKNSYKDTHNLTKLSYKAIKILEKDCGKDLIQTINFLIEQEELFPSTGFITAPTINKYPKQLTKEQKEDLKKEKEQLIEKAEEEFEKSQKEWDNNHIPIISMLNNYYTIEVTDEELHITKKGIKKNDDFNSKLEKILSSRATINFEQLVDNACLKELEVLVRQSKKIFVNGG